MCKCGYTGTTPTTENLIKIEYLGENTSKLIGINSKFVYGKRKKNQIFYIKEEDFVNILMRRV